MLHEKLLQVIEPAVESVGYELVLLEFVPHSRSATLRLYIDRAEGISLEDCERVSREVAALLDVEDPITQAYRLEVSSPGSDRPLVKPSHYARFSGEQVRVQTLVPVDGRRKFKGTLVNYVDDVVTLQTETGQVCLPLKDIEKARLVPNLEPRESDHE